MTSSFLGGPGFLAFVTTAVVVLATVLLARSLNKHLRKVRTHPPDGEVGAAGEAAGDAPDLAATHPTGLVGGDASSVGVEDDDGAGDEVTGESGDR